MLDDAVSISSFVIRFVQPQQDAERKFYRGSILHIQTNQECNFTRWEEALSFMEQFVSLDSNLNSFEEK